MKRVMNSLKSKIPQETILPAIDTELRNIDCSETYCCLQPEYNLLFFSVRLTHADAPKEVPSRDGVHTPLKGLSHQIRNAWP
jgi:hypothetical protein